MKSIKKLMHFNSGKAKDKHSGSQSSPDSKYDFEASKEMQELRDLRRQYEGLFEASNMVSVRALDFSSAIQQLAAYLINTFGSIEDGETGKVFKIVGRVQSEMSKILELYAAQVQQTLTDPTETLLSEVQNVEASKRQHDEKRQLYEQLRARIMKGRPKNGKVDGFADQQLQVVKNEFDKLSTFVNARLVSLEQGRPRSLITQAARHHTAQMHLFSRGHAALQAVEPYMRQVARERNIDREISLTRHGLNNDARDTDSNDDDDVSYMEELDTSDSSLEHSSRWNSRLNSRERSPDIPDEQTEVPKNLSKEWNSMLMRSTRSLGESSQPRQSGDYSHIRSNSGDVPSLRDGSVRGSGPPTRDGSVFNSGATTPRLAEQSRGSSFSPRYNNSKSAPLSARGLPVDDEYDALTPEEETFHAGETVGDDAELNKGDVLGSPRSRPPSEVNQVPTRVMDGAGFSTTSSEYTSQSVSTSARTSLDNHYHTSDPDVSASGMQSDSSGVSSKYSQKSVGFTTEMVKAKLPSLCDQKCPCDQKLPSPKQQQIPGPPLENPPVVSFVSPALSSTPLGFTSNTMDSRRRDLKRYSQSGPLTFNGMPWSSQPSLGNMGPSTSSQSGVTSASELHRSGPLGRSPLGRTFGSPRVSPCISPPKMSPPIISELHKLPPPPLDHANSTSTSIGPSNIIAHSSPLSKPESVGSQNTVRATPLPPPPLGSMPRSLSMPSRQKSQQYVQRSKPPTIPQVLEVSDEESASPSEKSSTAGGGSFSSQDRGYVPSVSSPRRDFSVQEVGLPPANLQFIHVGPSGSASAVSTPRSHLHIRPPSPSALSRMSLESQPHSPSLKSASPRTSRWRSLSISDTDNYLHHAAKAAVFKREFTSELIGPH
ncbi:hypothetical protein R1sor_017990 [Riccia sorocarpa]|uniref:BAR domain-containing protein n=1 Tax=Riccia sorocarpa TaxID=122646 RepID=A0ABD3I8H1_9MARC